MEVWREYSGQTQAGEWCLAGGTLHVLKGVRSSRLDNVRDLLVHLPTSYQVGDRRYPVIYMHDGQNLFDPATSYAGTWGIDSSMVAAGKDGLEAIVVGVPNMGERRLDEYSPFRDKRLGGGRGDDYLAFLIETVKPIVDRDFRTLSDPAHTGIIGSSMGGLISLYAFFRHPDVFGFAGVLSPSLWFAGSAILHYLDGAPFVPGRIHLDIGSLEGPGMVADVRRLRDLLRRKGYHPGETLNYVEEEGAGHSEAAWGNRFCDAVRFLMPRDSHSATSTDTPLPSLITAA